MVAQLVPTPNLLFKTQRPPVQTQVSFIYGLSQQPGIADSVISKKLPNVSKGFTKMISVEKLQILTPLQKLPKNVGDLVKLIVAKGFEKFPKVQ